LTSFYKWFFKDFNTLTSLLTEIIKKSVGIKWSIEQDNAFKLFKENLCLTPLSVLPDFIRTSKIECDALEIYIRAILM
jgi:hypothetical protein